MLKYTVKKQKSSDSLAADNSPKSDEVVKNAENPEKNMNEVNAADAPSTSYASRLSTFFTYKKKEVSPPQKSEEEQLLHQEKSLRSLGIGRPRIISTTQQGLLADMVRPDTSSIDLSDQKTVHVLRAAHYDLPEESKDPAYDDPSLKK